MLSIIPGLSLKKPEVVAFSAIAATYFFASEVQTGNKQDLETVMKVFKNFFKLYL